MTLLFYGLSEHSVILSGIVEYRQIILKQLEKKEPLPDKEKDQMAW